MPEALSVHYWNIQTIQGKVNNNWILYTPGLGHYCHIKVKVTQSCLTLCNPMDCTAPRNSPGQNTGVGSLSLLQGIFPTQRSNPGLPHCRWILYQLNHKGSPLSYKRSNHIWLWICTALWNPISKWKETLKCNELVSRPELSASPSPDIYWLFVVIYLASIS